MVEFRAYSSIVEVEINAAWRKILHNEFLAPDSGSNWESGLSLGYKPQAYFGLQLGYRKGDYQLSDNDSIDGTTASGSWSYQNLDASLEVSLPFSFIQPFFRCARDGS